MFTAESVSADSFGLVLARAEGLSSIGSVETMYLPSRQLVQAIGDKWQGCTALKGTYNSQVTLVSVLPCFPANVGEYPVTMEELVVNVVRVWLKSKKYQIKIIETIFPLTNSKSNCMNVSTLKCHASPTFNKK